jgi:hypothetical protein
MTQLPLPTFPALSDAQRDFLEARVARVLTLSEPHARLRAALLAIGGLQVVPPRYEAFEEWQRARDDWYTEAVLARGRTWDGATAVREPGNGGACHANVARLFVAGRGAVATGYALAGDGLWREHSWIVDGGGRVIETTAGWLVYHGCILDRDGARRFARDELGAPAVDGVS